MEDVLVDARDDFIRRFEFNVADKAFDYFGRYLFIRTYFLLNFSLLLWFVWAMMPAIQILV